MVSFSLFQGRTQNIFSGGVKPLLKNFLRISSKGKHILLEFLGGGQQPPLPPAMYGHGKIVLYYVHTTASSSDRSSSKELSDTSMKSFSNLLLMTKLLEEIRKESQVNMRIIHSKLLFYWFKEKSHMGQKRKLFQAFEVKTS